jgi:uncharacterized iron-regulated membrane protein
MRNSTLARIGRCRVPRFPIEESPTSTDRARAVSLSEAPAPIYECERLMADQPSVTLPKPWPDYRAVWRWHFYASFFCIPFVIILSITGGMYLFKPQVESWNDRPYDRLEVTGTAASAADQVRAALAAVPESSLNAYELPKSPNAAVRVIVRRNGEAIRVYVHPETLEILHTFPEDQRFMRWLFRMHGELLMGDRGSMLVELAASWTILMILTGLYLWWPRQSKGLGGIVYPRLRAGSRIFWRDIHSVTGVWISTFALFLLLSGLPWAKSWGNYLKAVRRVTGTAVAQQDWSNGSERTAAPKRDGGSGEHSGHGGSSGRGRDRKPRPLPKDLSAFDRIAATVRPLGLEPPVLIAPPAQGATDWSAKSMTANRPWRVNLTLNGETGQIVSRSDFHDKHLIDKIVSIGIAAHEGQLFGWPNQLIGLITAAGLVLISVSGLILWWQRREQGVLGAPKVLLDPRFSWGLITLIALFGVYLPLFGTSLIAVLLVEKLILRRIPGVRRWLGLYEPRTELPAVGSAS